MLDNIIRGIAAIAIAGIGYLLRKGKVSKEMTDLITSALERFVMEKAINQAEAWAEKKAKEIGQKVAGSEKMQRAVEEFTKAIARLKSYGIDLNVDLNEETLKARLQQVFDKIKGEIHSAE